MPNKVDMIVRGGTVVDGTGAAPFEADIAVQGGRIVEVGRVSANGREEIDAKGKLVTPGFVDIHTHYDGQVTWENRLKPSSFHGVTTAVMGNCGVGFAPCRPDQHDMLIRLMEGVEDIPEPVLIEGLPWNWESFPDYLDSLAARTYDMDFAVYVPHSALRVYVMGQRGADREPATAADRAEMARLVREAVMAGALGFGTSQTIFHRSSDGKSIPTLNADEDELQALAGALGACGRGVIQYVGDLNDTESAFAMLRRLAERSGRPLTFSMGEGKEGRTWRTLLDLLGQANDAAIPMTAQVLGRPTGMILGHELTMNPFYTVDSYRALSRLPFDQRIAELKRPEVRARILADSADPDPKLVLGRMVRNFDDMFELGEVPDYEPELKTSIAARAARDGTDPLALAYDVMLDHDGRNKLYLAVTNYAQGSLDSSREMLQHRDTVFGLGDGGAHCATICDASYSTFALAYWTRDRKRGPLLKLPDIVRAMTRDTARAVTLFDRGVVGPGYRADLNVIDFDHLRLYAPEVVFDLPGGGRRLIQRADGYAATIVGGEVTYRDGVETGALPGRLIRGGQSAPAN